MSDPTATTSRRADGWSAANQRAFLEAIAEGHGADAAAARVGLSATSAYAFRRTVKGTTFALGWRAATLVAREVVAETLMVRALHGQTDTYTRADGSVVTRHRHDNRLATSLLARLDRQVESAADADVQAARLVAQDFDSYLDLVGRDDGAARAGLLLARHSARLATALSGTVGDDAAARDLAPLYALAAADLFARTGVTNPADVPVADLDPARRGAWSADQWTRAEAAGMVTFAPPPLPPADVDALPSQHSQHSAAGYAVWWDDDAAEWRTYFPPTDDFDGEEHGDLGTPDYERTLDTREAAMMGTPPGHCSSAELDALAQVRDAFFAAAAPPPRPAPSEPATLEPSPLRDVAASPLQDTQEHRDMSIFGAIKKAIFGDHGPLGGQFSGKKDTPAAQPTPAPTAAPAPAPASAPTAAPAPVPGQATPAHVDVEAVLTGIAQSKGNPDLNWRTSIVDLMKLLDLDSSLANRKELATELGYTGAKDGSAEMNIWLHKAVMRELEKSGGTVPASLKD